MAKEQSFYKTHKKLFQTLEQYVPVVDKVHGAAHPEFHEVRRLFDSIDKKAKEKDSEPGGCRAEFEELRAITSNYTIPQGVCESYEAVYDMLARLDEACAGSE